MLEGLPIKPVDSYRYSSSYNLDKWLNTTTKTLTKFKAKSEIKNLMKLTQRLTGIEIEDNAILIFFDAKNLFKNIPKKKP